MFTSSRFAPLRTCSSATPTAASQSPAFTSFRNFAEPVTLVRSPIIWKFESGRIVIASMPEKCVSASRGCASGRGGRSRTASAIARMCSGRVPQQPPTTFTKPLCAHSRRRPDISPGVSS
jgi:hypothetical protein